MDDREAIAGIAVTAMIADGVIGGDEAIDLEDRLPLLPLFDGWDDVDLAPLLQRVDQDARAMGEDAFLEACAQAVPPRLRETAYLLAVEIVHADGDLRAEELTFLKRLRNSLQVDDAVAARILDVTRVRMRT